MKKEDLRTVYVPFCRLAGPADCEYRVDGKLSHIMLCGGNELNEYIKKCPFRQVLIAEETSKITIEL